MNTISKQIGYDYEYAKANPNCIIAGEKYRFTVLTSSLIRMEYSEDGLFEDRPTIFAKNRLMHEPAFSAKENNSKIIIETKNFRLTYSKNKPFKAISLLPDANLKVELAGTSKVWHYNHPEVRNFGAPGKQLTDEKGRLCFVKGLYSADGFTCIDDSKTSIVLESGNIEPRKRNVIDLYLFTYQADFGKCLKDYFALTGYPPMLPRYALGNWWSKDVSYSDEELKELVKDFEDNDIPISLIFLNHEWHINEYQNKKTQTGFSFNLEKFPNYPKTIALLHQHNIRLGLSIDPTLGIYPYENNYAKYKEFIGSNDDIIPFNAFDGKTYIAYFNFLIKPLLDMNIDAFWINNSNIPNDVQAALNIYHSANVMNLNTRIMLLTSNALVAPHKYPILYSGNSIVDWNTLKKIPFHNLSAANIGVSWWSHDIGGFHKGTEDNELYTRFVQLGVFSPIFKFGSEGGKYYKREPWLWEVKTQSIVKNYLYLRHRLIPYLYTEMYNYHISGVPLIKPLYYKEPRMYDDTVYRNEYYFGSEFFITPIIDRKDVDMNRVIHKFYLPEGQWYEYFSGKKFVGGKGYLYFVKDEDYPVFVKAGGIIPLSNNEKNDTGVPKDMEIEIFPGQSNIYNLYEDDGLSYANEKGYFIITSIEYQYMENNYHVIIKPVSGQSGVIPNTRNYTMRFRNTNEASTIKALSNNVPLAVQSYVDDNDLIVKIDNVSTISTFSLNVSGNNINIETNRIINDEIASIINDLQIETEMKEKIDNIIFSDMTINKKKIAIRKLQKSLFNRKGLSIRYVNLFRKLLEYVE